jgi:hypothetical protein
MNSKLTLKLNKRTIERAKQYSDQKKQSLSAIVENYFNIIVANDVVDDVEISPNVLELSGIVNLSDKFDLKQIYGKHLEEKYLK